ncbi:MAG: hypothetical protein ACXVHB_19590 [Solirubrobacteraceae bacterium]
MTYVARGGVDGVPDARLEGVAVPVPDRLVWAGHHEGVRPG